MERELKVFSTICSAADNSRFENPITVTLYVNSVNGVREGEPEIVCPFLSKGGCELTRPNSMTRAKGIEPHSEIDGFYREVRDEVQPCIQKNPQ